MLRSFLSAAIVLALFPNGSGADEDILELYHPDPRLPAELNEWLSIVQEHRNDFRLIREAAESRRKDKTEQAEERRIRSNAKREFHYLFDESEDEYDPPTSARPANAIYPHVYEDKSPRPRRRSDVDFAVAGESGEIARPGDKYPDRYKSNPDRKREIQIDIRKDGKLLKRIEDDQRRAKSYVFNVEEARRPTGEEQRRRQKSSIRGDELNGNFKNLYDANEHLNTDASLLKEDPFVYRVTLPDVDAYLRSNAAAEEPSRNNDFHRNDLQDMSPFWTGTEKLIMQKGIDLAQKLDGLPSRPADRNESGFQEVRSVVVEDPGADDGTGTVKIDDEPLLPPPRSIVHIAFEKQKKPDYPLKFDDADNNDLYVKPDKVFVDNEVRNYKRHSSHKRKRDMNSSYAKIEEVSDDPLAFLNRPLDSFPSVNSREKSAQNFSDAGVNFDYPGQNYGYVGNLDENAIDNQPKMDADFSAPGFNFETTTTETYPATWRPPYETLRPPKCETPDDLHYDHEDGAAPPSGGIIVEIRPAEDYEEQTTTKETTTKKTPVKKIKSMIEEQRIVTMIQTVTVVDDEEKEGDAVVITPRDKPAVNQQTFKLIGKTFVKSKPDGRRKHRNRQDPRNQRRAPKKTEDGRRSAKKRKHHLKRVEDYDKRPDSIPAFVGRRLREVDYVYDPNLGYPDLEESFKELEKKSVTRRAVAERRKDAVEGDYGDEEEAATQKGANAGDKLVKKTLNEFANPVTTAEEAEEYYEDYDVTGATAVDAKADVAKIVHHTKAAKPKKQKKSEIQKGNSKPKKKPAEAKSKPQPSRTFLEDSEFQQWPRFVRNDQRNEETLRKRSLMTQRNSMKRNNFPVSTKTFFVATPRRPRNRAVADSRSTEPPPVNTLTLAEFGSVGQTEPADSVLSGGNALDINVKFEEPFNNSAVTVKGIEGLITNATTESCEGEPQVKVTNMCEVNEEMFNRTEPAMTTALPIVPDSESLTAGYYEAFEKVDELLNGHIPFFIVEKMFNVMKKNQNFDKRFRSHVKRTRDPSMFARVRETSEQESRKIVDQMSELISKLQITTNCEILPPNLRHYLKTITKTKKGTVLDKSKSMEDIELDENQNQGTGKPYVFETGITADNMAEKVAVLRSLLGKFEGLPERCKPRAMPVKEYIQNHLGMLDKMLSRGEENTAPPREPRQRQPEAPRRIEKHSKPDDEDLSLSLIEQQLESLGLGKNKSFKPKFDLDELIAKNRHKKSLFEDEEEEEREEEEEQGRQTVSQKFHKLLDAIQKEKSKQSRVKRFDVVYGNQMGTRKTSDD